MSENLCRLCLKDCDASFNLNRVVSLEPTKSSKSVQMKFIDIFNFCTKLEAEAGDKLTQTFCNDCFDNILKSFQIIKTAEESHKILWRVVNSTIQQQQHSSESESPPSQEPTYNYKASIPNVAGLNDMPATSIVCTPTFRNPFSDKIKCSICKDLVPSKYVDFHFKKYHSDSTAATKRMTSMKNQSFPSTSITNAVNDEMAEESETQPLAPLALKTEFIENDEYESQTSNTEERILNLLIDLKADMETVKNKVFDYKFDFTADISSVDNSLFPLSTIEDLEATEAKIQDDPQFKMDLHHRFKSMGGKTEVDFFRNIARNIYSDELLQEVTWEGTQIKRKFSSFGNLIYLQINAINSSDDNFNATWNMAKEFYKGYLKNAPARVKKSRRFDQDVFVVSQV